MPRASSSSSAGCIRSRSDSEPTTIPTSGLDMRDRGDVLPVAHSFERDAFARGVGALARVADRVAGGGHVEDPAAVGYDLIFLPGRSGVEDECALRFRVADSGDPGADVPAGRIVARGEDDGHRSTVADAQVHVREITARPGGDRSDQVALEPRYGRLRLRIAEAAVELEHARPVVGEHESGEEHAHERG